MRRQETDARNPSNCGLLLVARNSKQLENTTFRKLDLFPFSSQERVTTTLLGPLEIANLKH
jgi:hypothetical protein